MEVSESGSGLTTDIQEIDTCSFGMSSTTEPKDECFEVCVLMELIFIEHRPCINVDSREIKMPKSFTKSLLIKK